MTLSAVQGAGRIFETTGNYFYETCNDLQQGIQRIQVLSKCPSSRIFEDLAHLSDLKAENDNNLSTRVFYLCVTKEMQGHASETQNLSAQRKSGDADGPSSSEGFPANNESFDPRSS